MKAIVDSKSCYDREYISKIIGLCDNSRNRFYKKNAVLFSENAQAEGVIYINSGKAKVYKTGFEGKKQIVRFASKGDILGVKSAISGKDYNVSATALEDMMICFIPKDNFLELLVKTPDLAHYLIDCLSKSLQEAENRNISIIQKTERQRLAEALLQISEKFHSDEIQLLKNDLVRYTSIDRNLLTNCLKSFRDRRLINLNSQRIKILDMAGLQKQANVPAYL